MSRLRPFGFIFSVFLAISSPAQALVTLDEKAITVDGFATLAATQAGDDSYTYLNADDDAGFDTDSIAGIQFSVPFEQRFAFTTQVIARSIDDYEPEVEWAFVRVDASKYIDLRAGRLRIPFFMISETLEVGYSYLWVRPPVDVYGQLGFSQFDGADLLIQFPVGQWDMEIQPFYGSTSPAQEFNGEPGELDVTDLWGASISLDTGWIILRAGHTEGDFEILGTTNLSGFLQGLAGAGFPGVADKFGIDNRHGKFSGVGFDLDYAIFKLIGEYTERKTDGLIADTRGWYVTFAARFGNVTPHITYSELSTLEDYSAVISEIPAISGVSTALAAGVGQFVAGNTTHNHSLTYGVRWDMMQRAALKAEFQKLSIRGDAMPLNPVFMIDPTAYQQGDDVEIFTLGVDVVF